MLSKGALRPGTCSWTRLQAVLKATTAGPQLPCLGARKTEWQFSQKSHIENRRNRVTSTVEPLETNQKLNARPPFTSRLATGLPIWAGYGPPARLIDWQKSGEPSVATGGARLTVFSAFRAEALMVKAYRRTVAPYRSLAPAAAGKRGAQLFEIS